MMKSMGAKLPGLAEQLSSVVLPIEGWDACERLLKERGAPLAAAEQAASVSARFIGLPPTLQYLFDTFCPSRRSRLALKITGLIAYAMECTEPSANAQFIEIGCGPPNS